MENDEFEKLREKEWKRNPLSNIDDSITRSMIGDPSALLKGGCLTKIITIIIIVIGLFILSKLS